MANTDANKVAYVTLAVAGTADTVTFDNYPTALRITNTHATENAWVNLNGDAAADTADNYLVAAGKEKVLRCPKQKEVVLSFVGDVDGLPTLAVERLRHVPEGEYVS